MTEKEAIRLLLYETRMSQAELAAAAGYKSQSNITGFLNNTKRGMRVDSFLAMIHAMGYKMTITSKETGASVEIDGIPEGGARG